MADLPEDNQTVGGKVLIVDDNVQNLELIQAYLEDLEVETITATNGQEAMDHIAHHPPDLILLVCRHLKRDPSTSDIPIIMITALNEISDIERGVESGTDDFLTKPVNKLELLTRVKSLLRLGHLKNELQRTLAYLSDLEMRQPK